MNPGKTASPARRIAFVEPTGAASNVFSQSMSIPMLGPVYLATLAEEAGFEVEILNENILGRMLSATELQHVDILCLSCMTATVERGKQIAHEYRELRRELGRPAHTVIGGIHASMIPEDVIGEFDQVFTGEAESKILPLLRGELTAPLIEGEPLADMDSLPIPNFKLIRNWEKITTYPVMTSRGCPYNCNFCSVTRMFGQGYRTRSVPKVMADVDACGSRKIFFVDDHFAIHRKRMDELLIRLGELPKRIHWSCQLRTEVSRDSTLLKQMRHTGCRTVYIGLESINPDSLKEMKKGQTVDDIRHAIRAFHDKGIHVHGMFMLGNDSDTKEIFELTSKFARRNHLASVQYLILTPLPGTELFYRLEKEKRLLHRDWRYYDALHAVFEPKQFTAAELQDGMIRCFSEFYNYTRAVNDAINAFFTTFASALENIYQHVHYPSLTPSLLKVAGRAIVRKWIRQNHTYCGYLKIVSQLRRPATIQTLRRHLTDRPAS